MLCRDHLGSHVGRRDAICASCGGGLSLLERGVSWNACCLGGEANPGRQDKKARIISSYGSLNQGCLCQRSLPIEKIEFTQARLGRMPVAKFTHPQTS